MTPESITLLIGALGGFFVVLGGGAKWLLSHLDAKDQAAALRESEARNELSRRLNDEISLLRKDISRMQTERALYFRRIHQLEGFIHRIPGIDIPAMEGWPPT
jgi:hypothetical protein